MEQIPEDDSPVDPLGPGVNGSPLPPPCYPRKLSLESLQQRRVSPGLQPRTGSTAWPRKMSFPSTSLAVHHQLTREYPELSRRYRR